MIQQEPSKKEDKKPISALIGALGAVIAASLTAGAMLGSSYFQANSTNSQLAEMNAKVNELEVMIQEKNIEIQALKSTKKPTEPPYSEGEISAETRDLDDKIDAKKPRIESDPGGTASDQQASNNSSVSVYKLNKKLSPASQQATFSVTLLQVEVFHGQHMTWTFEAWNRSDRQSDAWASYNSNDFYLTDEQGNRYDNLNARDTVSNTVWRLSPGVKDTRDVKFPAPIPGSKVFTCRIDWRKPSIGVFTVNLEP